MILNFKKMVLLVANIVILLLILFLLHQNISASVITYSLKTADKNGSFTDTGATFNDFGSALTALNRSTNQNSVIVRDNKNTVAAMKRGIAVTAGYLQNNSTVTFIDRVGGQPQYTQNNRMMWYYGTESEARVKVGISGLINYLPLNQVRLIPDAFLSPGATGSFAQKYDMGYYSRNSSGDMVHNVSIFNEGDGSTQFDARENVSFSSFIVDKAPSFMKNNVRYYSHDGINFFTNMYLTQNSRAGTFYPYFKVLPFRSRTSYTAGQLDSYIKHTNTTINPSVQSKLLNSGNALINAQNKHGVNALLELAFANLESAYGKSGFAVSRNNLFGINAVDSDPSRASYFNSVTDCINQHTGIWLSRGYFNAGAFTDSSLNKSVYTFGGTDWSGNIGDGRYFGTNAGNKANGINVRYASDPYHGEKVAGLAYLADKFLGGRDYGRYTIAVTKRPADVFVSGKTSSWKLYNISTRDSKEPAGLPILILRENGSFYRVQSDMPVVPVVTPGGTSKKIALAF
ncbi:MAG: glucosaminidase domain-containing protein, partial [Oscillospiraceae bacterium]|nr:glucosaminidase domain-containing protein [Oscillospiraceae bacterium]